MGVLGVTKLTFDNDWNITVPGWVEQKTVEPLQVRDFKPVGTAKKRSKKTDQKRSSQMALEIGSP